MIMTMTSYDYNDDDADVQPFMPLKARQKPYDIITRELKRQKNINKKKMSKKSPKHSPTESVKSGGRTREVLRDGKDLWNRADRF